MADHQKTEIHEISHEIYIKDQIVVTNSTETIIRDQTRTDKIRSIPYFPQTLGIEIIPTNGIEATQVVEIN